MSTASVLSNARIVLPDQVIDGSVAIEHGVITQVTRSNPAGSEDLGGDYLIPGLVELHTDHLEIHYLPRPNVRWDPVAAVQAHDAQIASSGITTVFDALRIGADADNRALAADMMVLADAIERAGKCRRLRADHHIHLRCELSSAETIAQIQTFLEHHSLRLVSIMDHTPGQRQFTDIDTYRAYFQGKTGISDAAFEKFVDQRRRAHHAHSQNNRRHIVELCASRKFTLASHDDATVEHIAQAAGDGAVIAEFPTTLEAAKAAREAGLNVLMGAPNVVRGGSHSGNVSAVDLARKGLLDILSSDYVPFSLLHAAVALADTVDEVDLPAAIRLVSDNPARAARLDDRGRIEVGLRADLVRVTIGDGVPIVRSVWRQGHRVA
jgi:alpha-D-ribose 1-methylphosphonate 5-triphosphate diphosphatase